MSSLLKQGQRLWPEARVGQEMQGLGKSYGRGGEEGNVCSSQVIRSQALCLLSILGARAAGENKKSGTEDCGYKEKTPSSLQTCTQKYKGLCRAFVP